MGDDPDLGLVLGGGGAFGAAHVGVLQVLAERGIRPGIVTGTSSGALVGAAYAAGVEQEALDRAAARIPLGRDRPLVAGSAMGPARYERHRRRRLAHARRGSPDRGAAATIRSLRHRSPHAARRDHRHRSAQLRAAGDGRRSRPASAREAGRELLADGGMIDNVPVGAARALGASRVIVVRLHAKWENVRMMRTVTRTAELVERPVGRARAAGDGGDGAVDDVRRAAPHRRGTTRRHLGTGPR